MNIKKTYFTNSSLATKKLGKNLAEKILKLSHSNSKEAIVLALKGELGSGKTTFIQGFAKGLGISEKILSPTFIIMKKFPIPSAKFQTNSKFQIPKFKHFYHIDCYRIKKLKEMLELGFKEIIKDVRNIVAIEWPEKTRKILPPNTIFIELRFFNKNKRKIVIGKILKKS